IEMVSVVTGATGCLGMSLTKRLVQEGHEVIALGRNLELGALLTQMGAGFVPVDLRDLNQLKKTCSKADYVFNCAALSSPWGPYEAFYQSNVLGTEHVVAATPDQARLIHVSSPSIYFDFTEKHNIKENEPLPVRPANNYVKTKLLAEEAVDKAFLNQKIKVVTIRPRAIFGPYDRAILPRILEAERKGVLSIIGSGANVIDITYVENVVESLILAAKADDKVLGKKYNITNDEPKTLMAILTLLYSELGKPLKVRSVSYSVAKVIAPILDALHRTGLLAGEPVMTQYTAGVMALGQTLNIEAAKEDLHYRPLVSIEQGMKQFANWYRA
ncbi:MAG: NAD-dependent epimerase/dehydratase family protein, partial [Legionellales bacterium]